MEKQNLDKQGLARNQFVSSKELVHYNGSVKPEQHPFKDRKKIQVFMSHCPAKYTLRYINTHRQYL